MSLLYCGNERQSCDVDDEIEWRANDHSDLDISLPLNNELLETH